MGAITLLVLEMVAIGLFLKGLKHEGAVCLVIAYFLYSPVSANVFQGTRSVILITISITCRPCCPCEHNTSFQLPRDRHWLVLDQGLQLGLRYCPPSVIPSLCLFHGDADCHWITDHLLRHPLPPPQEAAARALVLYSRLQEKVQVLVSTRHHVGHSVIP